MLPCAGIDLHHVLPSITDQLELGAWTSIYYFLHSLYDNGILSPE